MSFSEPMPLQLIALFARTAQKCRRTVTESVAHLDLTESRWRVMIHMSLLGEGCTQQMVAESLEIEMPSLTRTIKQLETTGLSNALPILTTNEVAYFTSQIWAKVE